jgi:hypothetical protein
VLEPPLSSSPDAGPLALRLNCSAVIFGGTVGHIAVCAKTWLVRGAAGRGCIFFIGGKNPKLGSHALARLAVHAEPIAEQELTGA